MRIHHQDASLLMSTWFEENQYWEKLTLSTNKLTSFFTITGND
jgi:hypothetical protein